MSLDVIIKNRFKYENNDIIYKINGGKKQTVYYREKSDAITLGKDDKMVITVELGGKVYKDNFYFSYLTKTSSSMEFSDNGDSIDPDHDPLKNWPRKKYTGYQDDTCSSPTASLTITGTDTAPSGCDATPPTADPTPTVEVGDDNQ